MSQTEKLGVRGLAKMTHGLDPALTEIVLVTPGCEGAAAPGAVLLHTPGGGGGTRLILGFRYCDTYLPPCDTGQIWTATLH